MTQFSWNQREVLPCFDSTLGRSKALLDASFVTLIVALFFGCAARQEVSISVPATDLRERMIKASPPLKSYVGEARLTYFGKEGRVKGTATLAVQRPRSMRYEVQGPHGGVLEAFATDGVELQLLDFKTNRYIYGPTRPDTIDQLLPFAPLGMDAAAWVALLCGEIVPPPEASVERRGDRFIARWEFQGLSRLVEIDVESLRARRAVAYRDQTLVTEIRVESRSDSGIPDRLELEVPEADVDMEIQLRDITIDPQLDGATFRIAPPASAERIYVSDRRSRLRLDR